MQIIYRNAIENATITVTSENASFPKYRLVDRDIGLLFKGTSNPNPFTITLSNLVLTELFETWASATDLTGWVEGLAGTSTVNREAVVVESGTYSCRFDIDAGGEAAYAYKALTLLPSTTYRVQIRYQNSAGAKTGWAMIRDTIPSFFLQDDGSWTTDYNELTIPNSNGVWATHQFSFTTHADITSYWFFVGASTGAASSSFYVDAYYVAEYWPADRIIIPKGHNLGGLTLTLLNEGATVKTWTAEPGLINQTFTSTSSIQWYLQIASPWAYPELAEIFLGRSYTFAQGPSYDSLTDGYHRNMERLETKSGRVKTVKFGELRRRRKYLIQCMSEAQKTEFETWEKLCEGVKFFYLIDHNGDTIYCELLNSPQFRPRSSTLWEADLEFLEVL